MLNSSPLSSSSGSQRHEERRICSRKGKRSLKTQFSVWKKRLSKTSRLSLSLFKRQSFNLPFFILLGLRARRWT